jgi:hypothetical protein
MQSLLQDRCRFRASSRRFNDGGAAAAAQPPGMTTPGMVITNPDDPMPVLMPALKPQRSCRGQVIVGRTEEADLPTHRAAGDSPEDGGM